MKEENNGAAVTPAAQPIRLAHPRPTIGRGVHYVLGEASKNVGEPRAATVSYVHEKIDPENAEPGDEGLVNLVFLIGKPDDGPSQRVVNDLAVRTNTKVPIYPSWYVAGVKYDAEGGPGTWHWPPGTKEHQQVIEANRKAAK